MDALLSPGSSGSPVLAVSCRTGEFELVGIYHAGYLRGSALNAVVAIDQVRAVKRAVESRASWSRPSSISRNVSVPSPPRRPASPLSLRSRSRPPVPREDPSGP